MKAAFAPSMVFPLDIKRKISAVNTKDIGVVSCLRRDADANAKLDLKRPTVLNSINISAKADITAKRGVKEA